jgi:heme exporter protein D
MPRFKSHKDPFSSDRSFPYVLLASTIATVVSLASVWIVTVQSAAQAMVA